MVVADGIVCPFVGLASAIPSGFSRKTAWDTLYLVGAGTGADAGGTGGSANHTHTSPGHTPTVNSHVHSVRTGSGTGACGGPTDPSGVVPSHCTHGHSGAGSPSNFPATLNSTIAITINTTSNDLDYQQVIWIESDGTPDGFAPDSLGFFESDNIPHPWERTRNNGYLKGADALGDGGATGGSNTHNHTSPPHTHLGSKHGHWGAFTSSASSEPLHINKISTSGFAWSYAKTGHTHSLSLSTVAFTINDSVITAIGSGNSEPLWKKVNIIKNVDVGNSLPDQLIEIWSRTHATIPSPWVRYTALDSLFVKGTNADGEVGDTGGSNTHNHTASDCLPLGLPHVHGVNTSSPSTTITARSGAGSGWGTNNHGHNGQWDTNLFQTNNSVSVTIDVNSHGTAIPSYVEVIFIQYSPTIPNESTQKKIDRLIGGKINDGVN